VQRPTTPSPTPTLTGWGELRARLPTPRSEVAAVNYANVIFVIGGFGGPKVVERYAPAAGTWIRDPDLPIGVDHAMAAGVLGGRRPGIFVIGGYENGVATDRLFYYLPVAQGGKWEELAPMPQPRAAGAAVAIGRKIYVVGGARDARTLHNSIYIYDVETDRWSVGPDMPTPRDHLAAAAVGSVVCAVGGRTLSMSRNLGALECYDPALDRWRKYSDMPTPRGGLGAAAVGNKLVVVGGERPEGTFKEVEIFDFTTGAWSRGQDLPHPRHGLGVVAIDRVIYAIAGGPTPGGSQTGIVEFWNLP
jgi:non-specific serine/threonine protein kinase